MIPTFLEGIESTRLPCSWVLLIPAAAITLFGRRRTALVVSVFVAVAMLVAWVRFAGWWFATPNGWVQIPLGFAIMATAAAAWKFDRGLTDVIAATVAGIVAVSAWTPCVGPRLADILNGANREPFAHIDGTMLFIAGLLLPFILVAAVGVLLPEVSKKLEHPKVRAGGAILFGLVGVLFATTLYDNLASTLFRLSEF